MMLECQSLPDDRLISQLFDITSIYVWDNICNYSDSIYGRKDYHYNLGRVTKDFFKQCSVGNKLIQRSKKKTHQDDKQRKTAKTTLYSLQCHYY